MSNAREDAEQFGKDLAKIQAAKFNLLSLIVAVAKAGEGLVPAAEFADRAQSPPGHYAPQLARFSAAVQALDAQHPGWRNLQQ